MIEEEMGEIGEEEMGEITIELQSGTSLFICNVKSWDQLNEQIRHYLTVNEIPSGAIAKIRIEKSNIECFLPDAFSDFSNLTIFKIEESKLSELLTFGVPNKLKELVVGNKITKIPNDYFNNLPNLELIDLTHNKIETIENDTFIPLTSLKRLVLADCGIKILHPRTFKGLKALEILDLKENCLENLPDTVFEDLQNLKELNLSVNNLVLFEVLEDLNSPQELPSNKVKNLTTFANLKNLRGVYLNDCSISCLPKDFSQKFGPIELLNLSSNTFTDIHPEAFKGLNKIKKICFEECNFTRLPIELFRNVYVDLDVTFSGNRLLKTIPEDTFQNFGNITSLNLELCKLKTIEAGTFKSLTSLGELNLKGNSLKKVEAGMFEGLMRLCLLELSVNKIAVLEEGCFENLKSLTYLSLFGNQLMCLKKNSFKDLSSLLWLSLGHNALKYVEGFEGLTNLRYLDLSNNWIKDDLENCCDGLNELRYLTMSYCELKNIGVLSTGRLNQLVLLDVTCNQLEDLTLDFFKHISPTCIVKLCGNKIPIKTLMGIFKEYPNLTIYDAWYYQEAK